MSGVGRFTGEDIIKGDLNQPFTLNSYGYCWGNPIKWVDLDGKRPQKPSSYDVWRWYSEKLGKSADRAWKEMYQNIQDEIDKIVDVNAEVGMGIGGNYYVGPAEGTFMMRLMRRVCAAGIDHVIFILISMIIMVLYSGGIASQPNFIFIIKEMRYTQKLKGLPCLLELLQDINWPIFQEVTAALMSFDKKDIIPFMERYLYQAYSEKDKMWISGIYMIARMMNI